MDRFLFPGRHGAPVPHLRCQLENSAERIHRTRPVWNSVCFSGSRNVDCISLHCAAGETKETVIMVSAMERPHIVRPQTPAEPLEPATDEAEKLQVMIDVCGVTVTYGHEQALINITLQ